METAKAILQRYGLIGYPLGHSFSPAFFRKKFATAGINACYDAFPLPDISELPELLEQVPLQGLNVTIPYKEAILPYLNALHEDARAIGAVNCIAVREGRLMGYNTDWIGFWKSLNTFLCQPPTGALVLGTGGAARAVSYALQKMQIPFRQVSRKASAHTLGYEQLDAALLAAYPLLINTTPLGTWPDVEAFPDIPYSLLTPKNSLYDLSYNPAETRFLQQGKAQGCRIKNGLEMLEIQAEESWKIWQQSL